jgi:hypothetical protein
VLTYIEKIGSCGVWPDEPALVELWDFSSANLNRESRVEAVCFVASTCYDSSDYQEKPLYERLLCEHDGRPASSFEFVRNHLNTDIKHSLRNCLEAPMIYETSNVTGKKKELYIGNVRRNVATFKLTIPIFIARQIVRHRSFSFQELSRRYRGEETPFLFWGSGLVSEGFYDRVIGEYNALIGSGAPKEVARSVIPVSCYTTIWVQGDLDAWSNYFSVRLDPSTQKQHRDVAGAMLSLLATNGVEFFNKLCLPTGV